MKELKKLSLALILMLLGSFLCAIGYGSSTGSALITTACCLIGLIGFLVGLGLIISLFF